MAAGGQRSPLPKTAPKKAPAPKNVPYVGGAGPGTGEHAGQAGSGWEGTSIGQIAQPPSGAFDRWLAARGLTRNDAELNPNLYDAFLTSFNGPGGVSPGAGLSAQIERERLAEQTRSDKETERIARERLERERQTQLANTQSGFVSDLMKQGQSPESFYNYLFARYGEQAPAGQQVQPLPLPAGDIPLTMSAQTGQYNPGELAPGVTRLGAIPGVTQGPSGSQFTLPPFLQRLFQQTGQNVQNLPIGQQAPGYKYATYGTPSAQSWNAFAPTEQANALGYSGSVVGTPGADEQANINRLAPQGTGLDVPTAFARGGVMMPPMPQGGVAMQPTMGPSPNEQFGEAGPEAAVPLNSPGGPMAMQALQQNQNAGMRPQMPPLPIQPTSRETGMYATKPLLPLADVPTNKLGPGMRGEAVVRLQRALEQTGLLQLPPGVNYGFYGPLTTEAVARLQQETGQAAGQPGLWDGASARMLTQRLQGPQGPQGPNPYLQRPEL